MDISSTQRLAAYTRDLGIEKARTTGIAKADPATASRRAESGRGSEAAGVRVSLSASAQALSPGEKALGQPAPTGSPTSPVGTAAAFTPTTTATTANTGETANTFTPADSEIANRSPRSNRSVAIEAYQKNASAVSGSRIQVIA